MATPEPALDTIWLHSGPSLELSLPTSAKATRSWKTFSRKENDALEKAWVGMSQEQKDLALQRQRDRNSVPLHIRPAPPSEAHLPSQKSFPHVPTSNESINDVDEDLVLNLEADGRATIVPVGQDGLFTANLEALQVIPAFWRGPGMEMIRASWFFPGTSRTKYYPVDPDLAASLEDAYRMIRPYSSSFADELRSALAIGSEAEAKLRCELQGLAKYDVIFQGPTSGRLYARGVTARLSKTLLTLFQREKHGGGTLVVRGFRAAQSWRNNGAQGSQRRSQEALQAVSPDHLSVIRQIMQEPPHLRQSRLESFVHDARSRGQPTAAKLARLIESHTLDLSEEWRARQGRLAQGDTSTEAFNQSHQDESPEVHCLVLVIHGIGQELARAYDSFDFVHAVNQLRAGCARVNKQGKLDHITKGKRAQFLPIKWRHTLKFETPLDDQDPDNSFTLDDIQVKGSIPFVREVVSKLVLDVPLYMSHQHASMIESVVTQANLAYRLFCSRNPGFLQMGGRVAIIGHSLGSALTTDILSTQPTWLPPLDQLPSHDLNSSKNFCFNSSTVFFLGSPVAFFLHLHRKALIARRGRGRTLDVEAGVASDTPKFGCLALDSLYAVYGSNDPVSYCLNAAVDSQYARRIAPIRIPSALSTLHDLTVAPSQPSWFSWGSWWQRGQKPIESTATDVNRQTNCLPIGMSPDSSQIALLTRAAKKFRALNPTGCIDFELPSQGISPYVDMIAAHSAYWTSVGLHQFILTQLFVDEELLRQMGRIEVERAAISKV